jgi:thiol-disulfide isomerase/thioredoxin
MVLPIQRESKTSRRSTIQGPRCLRCLAALLLALTLGQCGGPPQGKALSLPAGQDDSSGVSLVLPRLDGTTVSVAALRGHPILLTLFATWSLRCQAEAPWFVRLHERYGQAGLILLGIALDPIKPALIQTYAQYVGFSFPVLLARADELELVGALGRTANVPRTVLLDRQGHIVLDQQGQTILPQLETQIRRLLGADAAARARQK